MPPDTVTIAHESPEHGDCIEQLNSQAFGPGRFTRTAYRLREHSPPDPDLCFVAFLRGQGGTFLAGSVRQSPILVGAAPALLLGPLVVDPAVKNIGIGRELMNRTMFAARRAGHQLVLLVGDLPYYARFGFAVVPPGRIDLPGPVDPGRFLYCELQAGALAARSGMATPPVQKCHTRPFR